MTTTTGTAASSLPASGGTSMQGLADWAAPYITNYLGKSQALGEQPYQTYQGPLTAGASDLQTQAFGGIGSLTVPNQGKYTPVGGSFTDTFLYPSTGDSGEIGIGDFEQRQFNQQGMAPINTTFGQPRSVAEQYMNPYLEQALNPTLNELRRQSQITGLGNAAKMTGAGAFGGSRQAILDAENQRNLLSQMAKTTGEGYATAYDKAMAQYNAEQARKINEAQFGAEYGLKGLAAQQGILDQQLKAGATQRDIEQQGITADLEEFNRQREYPYKQVQFMRDMISGLPTSSVTNTPAQLSGVAQLITAVGGIDKLLQATGQGNLGDLLKNLGLNFGSSSENVLP